MKSLEIEKIEADEIGREETSLAKIALKNSGIGACAALLFSALYMIIYSPSSFGFREALYIILFCSAVSGVVGVGEHFLGKYLHQRGIKSQLLIGALTLGAAILFVGGIVLFLYLRFDFLSFLPLHQIPSSFFLWVGMGGFFVAILTMILDATIWKIRRKMLILEMENRYLEDLSKKERELEEVTKNLILAKERNRMARELHDSISQGLHGIKYSIHSLRQRIDTDPRKAWAVLNHLEATTEETLKELRHMIAELKPSRLEEKGLCQALIMQCHLFAERSGLKLTHDIDESKRLTPEQELAIYRVLQEALTNIQKHSRAQEVRVLLKEMEGRVYLTIADNGQGLAEGSKKGHGLENMKARVFENNGSFQLESKEGEGLIIRITFKLLEP